MATASVTSPAGSRSIDEIRAEFPILERRVNGQPLAYLDNGATAQTPLQVLEAMDHLKQRRPRHDNLSARAR